MLTGNWDLGILVKILKLTYFRGPNKRGGRIKSIACKNIDFLIRVLACNKSIACKAKSSTVDKRCGARKGSIFHR